MGYQKTLHRITREHIQVIQPVRMLSNHKCIKWHRGKMLDMSKLGLEKRFGPDTALKTGGDDYSRQSTNLDNFS